MALNAPRSWLIAYDIANPRRLCKLHRFLVKHAMPIQYSVFHFEGSPAHMGQLMAAIETRIDLDEDDVRAYLLPKPLQIITLGRGSIPGETMLLSDVSPSLQTLLEATGHC